MVLLTREKLGKQGARDSRNRGKEIEELTGVQQNRASEIWTAYQQEGSASLKRKKYGRKPGSHMVLTPEEQENIRKQRVNMISAISSQGSVRFMVYQDAMNQQRLIRFMERLMRTSEQKVFLILDNLKVHHGKLAAAWLKKNKEKMEVFFLPPYAPEYNPDEYLNHALKISVHSGQLPYTAEDISHKIQSFMRRLQHHPSA